MRWVGGFARMDTVSPEEYRAAEPDPTQPIAARAAEHLNKDHADGLLLISRELAGARGAVSAVCTGIDRYGIDLSCTGAGQSAAARVQFDEPLAKAADVRPAAVALVKRGARASGRRQPARRVGARRHVAGIVGKDRRRESRRRPAGEQPAHVAERGQQAQRGAELQVGGVRAGGGADHAGGDPRIDAVEMARQRREVRAHGDVARAVDPPLDRDDGSAPRARTTGPGRRGSCDAA